MLKVLLNQDQITYSSFQGVHSMFSEFEAFYFYWYTNVSFQLKKLSFEMCHENGNKMTKKKEIFCFRNFVIFMTQAITIYSGLHQCAVFSFFLLIVDFYESMIAITWMSGVRWWRNMWANVFMNPVYDF